MPRQKNVYTTSEIPHLFATPTAQASARNAQGNLYYETRQHIRTLYSYGYHYPIAALDLRTNTYVLNLTSSSSTTNGQRYDTRRAIPDCHTIVHLHGCLADPAHARVVTLRDIDDLLAKAAKAKTKAATYTAQAHAALTQFNTANELLALNLPPIPESTIPHDLTQLRTALALEAKAKAERLAKHKAAQAKLIAPAIAHWLAHTVAPSDKRPNMTRYQITEALDYTPCRLSADRTEVETLGGARITLAAAKRLHRSLSNHSLTRGTAVGVFTFTGRTENFLVVGCHTIAIADINRIAAELELAAIS